VGRDDPTGSLARHAPGLPVTGLAAAVHADVTLPPATNENAVIDEAGRRAVGLYGMSTMRRARGPHQPQFILGFGDTSRRAIEAGIAAVADLLRGPVTQLNLSTTQARGTPPTHGESPQSHEVVEVFSLDDSRTDLLEGRE
jgi:hypothetical protein